MLKFRDILYETVIEHNRSGEFVRIFPCKGSKPYEKYFSGVFGTRMLNRLVHKSLFTSEVLVYDKLTKLRDGDKNQKLNDPKSLKYNIQDVPEEQSYDHYKTKAAMVRQNTKRNDSNVLSQGNTTPTSKKMAERSKGRRNEGII
jgi:hypothetical protein